MAKPLQFSIFYGYREEEISEWCGVTLRTARRWRSGELKPSPQAVKLFLLYRDRRVLTTHWRGWIIKPEGIVDPDGAETTRAQLHNYWFIVQLARELARDAGPQTLERYQRLLA